MITIEINAKKLTELRKATEAAGKKFAPQLAAAINAVAKKVKLKIGRDVRSVIALKKDESEKPLKIEKKATPSMPQAVVRLRKTPQLGLEHFGAKQNKTGVSFKISKKGGRGRVARAFMGARPGSKTARWGGGVFVRSGTERGPIHRIRGVSAYGAYVKNDFSGPQVAEINAELNKQMDRRIKLNILRASGLVSR